MVADGKDFFPVNLHGIAGELWLGIIKNKLVFLKNPHRDAGKVADRRAKIANIQIAHFPPPLWLQVYRIGYKNARGGCETVVYLIIENKF
jgi:hypothetical protein